MTTQEAKLEPATQQMLDGTIEAIIDGLKGFGLSDFEAVQEVKRSADRLLDPPDAMAATYERLPKGVL